MKIPEKIYFNQIEKGAHYYTVSNPIERKYVEYVRKDAFIEKVAEWLNNFYNEDTHSYLIDEDIEKFINYMKGE